MREVSQAIETMRQAFPFRGYTDRSESNYTNVASAVLRHLPRGSKVLDFGSGPCDKTGILQILGYQCAAFDDLGDYWHSQPGVRDRILRFAAKMGIDLRIADGSPFPWPKEAFDMVMLCDVLEHLHDSPRDLLNDLLELAGPEALLFITVPNAVNIRKRLNVLRGRTNLPPFEYYYWHPGPFRGHVREYVHDDLVHLSRNLGLEIVELTSCHLRLHKLPAPARPVYKGITALCPGWRDSWLLVARKKPGWLSRKTLPEGEMKKILNQATTFNF